jgi:hypothetical protein
MHQAVLAEENATLDHFWEQLFVDMGTDEWGNPSPNTPKGLKGRFSWVHEYITKGKMPVEVLRFMDALRQVTKSYAYKQTLTEGGPPRDHKYVTSKEDVRADARDLGFSHSP